MFHQLKFVVASTPRSGTRYIAAVLNKARIFTTHELLSQSCHNYWGSYEAKIEAEVSWLLVPSLAKMPKEIALLHQTRHPVPAINSIVRTGHMVYDETKNTEWLFKQTIVPRLGFIKDLYERAMYFWFSWHSAIMAQGVGRKYFRYQIETLLGADLSLMLENVLDVVPNRTICHHALEDTPKNYNACGSAPSMIGWNDLTSEVKELAERMGYSGESV